MNNRILTISGLAGTGTSSMLAAVKQFLEQDGYAFHSCGDLMRSIVAERGYEDLSHGIQSIIDGGEDPDKLVDDEVIRLAETQPKLVLEGRIVSHILEKFSSVKPTTKVLLTCPDDIRFRRIAERENISYIEARVKSIQRDQRDTDRYKEKYGFHNIWDPTKFTIEYASNKMFPSVLAATAVTLFRGSQPRPVS